MEIDRMLYLLKSFVFVSLKFSFSILLFSLPISVNFSIFFHLFCEIAVFSYVFERELARESKINPLVHGQHLTAVFIQSDVITPCFLRIMKFAGLL